MNPYKELVLAQMDLWNLNVKAGMPLQDANWQFVKNVSEFHTNRRKLEPK